MNDVSPKTKLPWRWVLRRGTIEDNEEFLICRMPNGKFLALSGIGVKFWYMVIVLGCLGVIYLGVPDLARVVLIIVVLSLTIILMIIFLGTEKISEKRIKELRS